MAFSQVKAHCNSNETPKPNEFGLYLHIPFCVHKCSYCDFYSFTKYSAEDFKNFAKKLRGEIAANAEWLAEEGLSPDFVSSIFFGGGTPSLLPSDLLASIFETIDEWFLRSPDCEITLEANPETVSSSICREWRQLPFNRVSLGAQSFSRDALDKLERLGSRESILRAANALKENAFENFSLDLIFGIPGQGWEAIAQDIESAASLGPKHLSFYNLTLKPGHPLFRSLPNDDSSADWYEAGVARLARLGYERYEVSNFATSGFHSRHNLLYWSGGEFLGVGPSAASRLFSRGRFFHRKQVADFSKYLSCADQRPNWSNWEATSTSQTILEATFLELRKREGIHVSQFAEKYGYDLTQASQYLKFLNLGLIERRGDYLCLTSKGLLLADSVTMQLMD